MDKQIKLRLTINHDSKEVDVPLGEKQTEPLFVFSEYANCQIELITSEKNVYLEWENLSEQGILKILPHSPYMFSDVTNPLLSYVPGNYMFSLCIGNKKHEYYFSVSPQSLTEDSLKKMCRLLEEHAKGITRNQYSHQLVVNSLDEEEDFDLFGYFVKNFDALTQSLTFVLNHPIEDLTKDYQLTKTSQHQDAKSLKWQATKGPYYDIKHKQSMFYEKRIKINYDTIENRALKHMLFQISNYLFYLNKKYHKHYRELLTQKKEMISKIEQLNHRKDNVTEWGTFKKTKTLITQELYIRNEELSRFNEKVNVYEQHYRKIQRMNGQLMSLLNDAWLTEISSHFTGKVSQRFMKTTGYSEIYRLYQDLTNLQQTNKHREKTPQFPIHKTNVLFEYYNLFLIIQLLKQRGFEWETGWIKNRSHDFSLNEGEEMFFKNDKGYRIKISYDKFLKVAQEIRHSTKEQLVSVNSSSRRPDILIELFNKKNNFLSAMIIEVKYRKLHSIYQTINETNAMKQMIDYQALGYFNPNDSIKLNRQAVDTVLAVYPNHEGSCFVNDVLYNLKFIPLSPTGFDDSIEGVSEIKESLFGFLSRHCF